MERAHIRYATTKSFGKLIGKRFALRHASALETVARASGYRNWNELSGEAQSESARREVDFGTWIRRLGAELGSDLEVLMTSDELTTWHRRLHGVSSAQCDHPPRGAM